MIPFRAWAVPYGQYIREVTIALERRVYDTWCIAQFNIAVSVQQRRGV